MNLEQSESPQTADSTLVPSEDLSLQPQPGAGEQESNPTQEDSLDAYFDSEGNFIPPAPEPTVEDQEHAVEATQYGEEHTSSVQKDKRYRFNHLDDTDAQALAIARDQKISLEAALAQVKAGQQEPNASPPQPAAEFAAEAKDVEEQLKALPAQSQADLEKLIIAKREEILAAKGDLDTDAEVKATKELYYLEDSRSQLAQLSQKRDNLEKRQQDAIWDSSESQAIQLYPEAGEDGSALRSEMIRLDRLFKQEGDPIYSAADKPLILARMAANNLGIAPSHARPASAKRAQPAVRNLESTPATNKAPATPVAPGSARTSSTPQSNKLEAELEALRSPEDVEEWITARLR